MSSIPRHLIAIIDEYEAKVLALKDVPEIVESALHIAYYSAMIDAANDDPMDDPKDQAEALAFFNDRLKEHVENFQNLTHDYL